MRVAIADDAVLLREGIARLLADAGFEVVATYGDAESLLVDLETRSVDVCVLDIKMPPTFTDEGLRAAAAIRARWPQVGVLVLSQYVELGLAIRLLADGAEGLGYLLKDRVADVEEFVDAVRRVGEGGSALDPTVVSQMLSRRQADEDLGRLTPREHLVLEAMAQGLANRAIADRLHVSVRAVEKHVTNIFDKLGLAVAVDGDRRVLAVLRFLRRLVTACRTTTVRHTPRRPRARPMSCGGGDDEAFQSRGPAAASGRQGPMTTEPPSTAPAPTSPRRFARHYLLMIVAMYAGMLVLDPVYAAVASHAGYADPWAELPVLSALVMAGNMTVPMVLLMLRHRHGFRAILEMAVSMFAPTLAATALHVLGVLPADQVMTVAHLGMFPAMLLVMLRRYRDYAA